eukprot:10476869-Lingulodinium_polyedra.AAC.1
MQRATCQVAGEAREIRSHSTAARCTGTQDTFERAGARPGRACAAKHHYATARSLRRCARHA